MTIGGLIMDSWMVAFAKILIDKESGISLQGIYLGGISDSCEGAEQLARDCVNTIKGGTILPRVYKLRDDFTLIDALYEAADRFEIMTQKMQEADSIINKSPKAKIT